jgi:phosphoglycolate phosphatase
VSPRPAATAVIFDLDGTLVQTRAASWSVFRGISDEFGLGLTTPEQYFDLFRGNVFASLDVLCAQRGDADRVRKAFLTRLREEYNPALVPGMAEVVRRLAGHCTLAVVSSNAMEVLRRVLLANDIAYCFAHVFSGDVTPGKADAIRSFLADGGSRYRRRCEVSYDETTVAQPPGLGTTVLVTDTIGDVHEALAAGIRAVGVAWGMHSTEELTGAGAEFVAIWPQELPGYLIGDAAAEPLTGACALPGRQVPASDGGAGRPAGDVSCSCGCSVPVAARLASAARIRRARRQRAAISPGRDRGAARDGGDARAVVGARAAADALVPGELLDAARRIMPPASR